MIKNYDPKHWKFIYTRISEENKSCSEGSGSFPSQFRSRVIGADAPSWSVHSHFFRASPVSMVSMAISYLKYVEKSKKLCQTGKALVCDWPNFGLGFVGMLLDCWVRYHMFIDTFFDIYSISIINVISTRYPSSMS